MAAFCVFRWWFELPGMHDDYNNNNNNSIILLLDFEFVC